MGYPLARLTANCTFKDIVGDLWASANFFKVARGWYQKSRAKMTSTEKSQRQIDTLLWYITAAEKRSSSNKSRRELQFLRGLVEVITSSNAVKDQGHLLGVLARVGMFVDVIAPIPEGNDPGSDLRDDHAFDGTTGHQRRYSSAKALETATC